MNTSQNASTNVDITAKHQSKGGRWGSQVYFEHLGYKPLIITTLGKSSFHMTALIRDHIWWLLI